MNLFDIINVPLGWIMKICYELVDNYFVALLLFAVVMQLILLPFSIKQQKNSVRQAQLAPKTAALRKKYAGRNDAATQQKLQEETLELYKRENYNPASGCLPLVIQMPILFALVNVVYNPLRYITGLTAEQVKQLQTYLTDSLGYVMQTKSAGIELLTQIHERGAAAFESVVPGLGERVLPTMKVGALDFSAVPQIAWDWLLLVPILTFVFALLSQIIIRKFTYQSPEAIEAAKNPSMKIMNFSMPLLSVWIAFTVPAAIGVYWIFRNIIMTVQQILLSRLIPVPHFTEEDYKRAEKEMKVGRAPREKSKVPPRSLHHIDDEEYQERIAAAEEKAAEEAAETADGTETGADDSSAEAAEDPAARIEEETESVPVLKEDEKTAFEKKKITPSSGPKYDKTGKNYKKK